MISAIDDLFSFFFLNAERYARCQLSLFIGSFDYLFNYFNRLLTVTMFCLCNYLLNYCIVLSGNREIERQ